MLTIGQINNNTVIKISPDLFGLRLDTALAIIITDISRSRLQSWIKNGIIMVNGKPAAPNYRVKGGESVAFNNLKGFKSADTIVINNTNNIQVEELKQFSGVDLALKIIYQDEDILVVDKPAGLVVHPGASNHNNTLMNGLLFHYPELYEIPRAGIVHRIDKDTSGLLVVARNLAAHFNLVQQLANHSMKRTYKALVYGTPAPSGTIDTNLIRDKNIRTRMAVTKLEGKNAVTYYKLIENFAVASLVECHLKTGRTHQIRVHLQYLGFPILGDQVYGQGKIRVLKNKLPIDPADNNHPLHLNRQALHAEKLQLIHPKSAAVLEFNSAIPADFLNLLNYFRELKWLI